VDDSFGSEKGPVMGPCVNIVMNLQVPENAGYFLSS
jgi:hypothetical protein